MDDLSSRPPSLRVKSSVTSSVRRPHRFSSPTARVAPNTVLHHAQSFSSLHPSKVPVPGVAKPATPATRHVRTGSGSSNSPPPPMFYPITTATPAANPYRYAPPRPSRPASPLVPPVVKTNSSPPLSPPISSVSISSHSSVVSRNADEHSPTAPPLNGHRHHNSSSDSYDWAEDDDSDELDVKAAAKSNRKIADLEITNRSLMVINASLETTKHKQAKEIRELRRKLRESRLILPPRAYRAAVQSSLGTADNDEDNDDDEDEDEEETDDTFLRVKAILENLLESGKRALEAKVSTAKVLSAEQVRSWRRVSVEGDDSLPPCSDVNEVPLDIDQSTINPSSPPPIFVTPSP